MRGCLTVSGPSEHSAGKQDFWKVIKSMIEATFSLTRILQE